MLAVADEGDDATGSASRVKHASDALLAHRHAQLGRATLGDAHDRAFAEMLHGLPTDPLAVAALRAAGERLGRDVYAKPFVDAPLDRALVALAEALRASGFARLELASTFHRSARLLVAPVAPAAGALVEGIVEGFLSECFNCDATAAPQPDGALLATLGRGRDVNRRPPP